MYRYVQFMNGNVNAVLLGDAGAITTHFIMEEDSALFAYLTTATEKDIGDKEGEEDVMDGHDQGSTKKGRRSCMNTKM